MKNLAFLLILFFAFNLAHCGSATTTATNDDSDSTPSSDSDSDSDSSSDTSNLNPPFDSLIDLDDCPADTSNLLSTIPVSSDEIGNILPLGLAEGTNHTFPTGHTYMTLNDKTDATPIVAPADMTIYRVDLAQNTNTNANTYSVSFALCSTLAGHFGHVSLLEDSINTAVNFTDSDCSIGDGSRSCSKEGLSISVTAGQTIAYIGGEFADTSNALDFGLIDADETSYNLVDSSRENEDAYNPHVVCPYDYYAEGSTKDTLFDLLASGRSDSLENCGSLDTDLEDTAQGRWYQLETEADDELDHVHLGIHFRDTSESNISIGSNNDLTGGVFTYTHNSSGRINPTFANISADGNKYCIGELASSIFTPGDVSGYFLFEMTDSTTIKIESFDSGTCPTDPNTLSFTSEAVSFER